MFEARQQKSSYVQYDVEGLILNLFVEWHALSKELGTGFPYCTWVAHVKSGTCQSVLPKMTSSQKDIDTFANSGASCQSVLPNEDDTLKKGIKNTFADFAGSCQSVLQKKMTPFLDDTLVKDVDNKNLVESMAPKSYQGIPRARYISFYTI
jgi:hypothetical protein